MISDAVLDAMVEAGCTAAQVVAAVKAAMRDDILLDERRRDKERTKKAAQRARPPMSPGQRGTYGDSDVVPGTPSDLLSPLQVSPHTPLPKTPNPHNPLGTPKGVPLPPEKSASPRAGSRLPDDFKPDLDWAVEAGMRPETVLVEAARFRDYWTAKAGPNAVKRDWPATWRNWVRAALERQPVPRGRSPPRRDNLADFLNENFAWMEHGHVVDDHAGLTLEARRADGADQAFAAVVQFPEARRR